MKWFIGLMFIFIGLIGYSCTNSSTRNNELSIAIDTDSIVKEGYELYYLEKASWISTDKIIEKYKNLNNIEYYLTYITYRDGEKIVSTYWKKQGEKLSIFSTFTFNSKSDLSSLYLDETIRDPNAYEKYLLDCQNKAINIMSEIMSKDKFYNLPQDCRNNFVFLGDTGQIRVFVLTGTKKEDIIPFGNDYHFSFDLSGNLLKGSAIHPLIATADSLIHPALELVKQEKDKDGNFDLCSHYHYGLNPECITSTDICNILLYGKSDYYSVFSRNNISLFQPRSIDQQLLIMPISLVKKQK